ncbi:GNAT family N-acetyltransferase [Streptomyces sp. NPDC051104]|uniref:GNAT family N-acetyltransferase n=1 Tax=Streptomyces sp. NPDC051104 TaxID=3155044 RepID=UPI00343CB19B
MATQGWADLGTWLSRFKLVQDAGRQCRHDASPSVALLAIHRDSETCLHNPSDALTRLDEAGVLHRRWNDQWQRCGYGYWAVRRHGPACNGASTRSKPVELHSMKVLDLFYRFATSAWGQGLASKPAAAVTAWASPTFQPPTDRPRRASQHRLAARGELPQPLAVALVGWSKPPESCCAR